MESNNILASTFEYANNLKNWLIPALCSQCRSHNTQTFNSYCEQCYTELSFQHHCCRQCGQSLGAKLDYCGRCLQSPPAYDACFCPFQYESPISDQIQKFKYGDRPELAKSLAQLTCHELVTAEVEMPQLIVPVPLHISRLRQRGFNQSLLLAKEISKILTIPYSNKVLKKTRATPAQASLNLEKRMKNLKNSFCVLDQPKAENIAIIDDVFTTGATANEISKQLKKKGVSRVQIWTIAHTAMLK